MNYNRRKLLKIRREGQALEIDLGHRAFIVRRRYEALSALNDFLIALWFLIGSFFFLSASLELRGTWLFILGSAQLMIKPLLKLISILHLGRIDISSPGKKRKKRVSEF